MCPVALEAYDNENKLVVRTVDNAVNEEVTTFAGFQRPDAGSFNDYKQKHVKMIKTLKLL